MSKIEEALEKAHQEAQRLKVAESPLAAVEAAPAPAPASEESRTVLLDLNRLRERRILGVEGALGGPVTEEYRRLRMRLLQATKSKGQNVVMVCSAAEGEGKTLTSINLALSLSREMHQTALVVDADLRRPALHEVLGIPQSPGLSEYLTDAALPLEAVLLRTNIEGFSVIPAGQPIGDATERLASQRMQGLVAEVKQRYPDRYIIVDSPPLAYAVDAAVLAAQVDAILLVIDEGRTSRQTVSYALQTLDPTKILGVVLNRHKGFGRHYGNYGGYT